MSWTAASMVILGLALAGGFAWWERSRPPSRLLALVATLAALAALGRIAFAPLPNVKPTTDIVLFAGLALGAAPGFMVGAVAALASNVFFGQGPWTPWQMAAWGLVGLLGAGLALLWRGRTPGRVPLAVVCGAAGLGFGLIMNVSMWVTYGGDHSLARLVAYQATSAPFDIAHAVGNVVFCLAFGPALVAALARFRARLDVRWVPVGAGIGPGAGAAAAAVLVALVVAIPLAAPAPAAAATGTAKPAQYLRAAQNADGGFGAAPGQRSSGLYTAWAALGLAAAGQNPLNVRRKGGRSVVDYLRRNARTVTDLGEIDRTILLLVAAGRNPRSFAGRNLVSEVLRAQRRNGAFAGRVNTTAYAVLALRAAGRKAGSPPVRRGARWIERQANRDGGFNFAGRGGPSGVDDTSAALLALAAAGRRGGAPARNAARYLERSQNGDGGFPILPGGPSNAQSTAWAMQGLLAAGRNLDRVRRNGSRTPAAYLRSLTGPNGAIRYSRTSAQTPVWVTGTALLGLARKPFPLKRVARRASRSAATPALVARRVGAAAGTVAGTLL
jgi:energy-coupling factor transport system substrate-specific component